MSPVIHLLYNLNKSNSFSRSIANILCSERHRYTMFSFALCPHPHVMEGDLLKIVKWRDLCSTSRRICEQAAEDNFLCVDRDAAKMPEYV